MKYCPRCRKPTLQTEGDCPHCGNPLQAGAADVAVDPEPSYEQMSGFEEVDESSSLELDIAPPTTRYATGEEEELGLTPDAESDGAPTPPPRPTALTMPRVTV